MKYYHKFVFSFYFLIFLACDESCDPTTRIIGVQYLNEEVSGKITNQNYPDTITFINQESDKIRFTKFIDQKAIVAKLQTFDIECENGDFTTPFIDREIFQLGYSSSQNDSIILRIESFTSRVASDFSDIQLNDTTQISKDILSVILSFKGCERVNTYRRLQELNGEINIEGSPFPSRKFGQTYHDSYGIDRAWSNGVVFTYQFGITSFDYCGRDYTALIE